MDEIKFNRGDMIFNKKDKIFFVVVDYDRFWLQFSFFDQDRARYIDSKKEQIIQQLNSEEGKRHLEYYPVLKNG